MNAGAPPTWEEMNQKYLTAELTRVRSFLETGTGAAAAADETDPSTSDQGSTALDTLCAVFGLTPFERDVLLLCAGMELDGSFAELCARAQRDAKRAYPTFGLALSVLPQAHWSALVPTAPLRYWRLIELGAGPSLATSPARVDERVLHYLAGVSVADERLQGLIEAAAAPVALPPTQSAIADRASSQWERGDRGTVIQLCGDEASGAPAIAAVASARAGFSLHVLRARGIPHGLAEREALVRLWEREALLGNSALLVDCHGVDGADALADVVRFVERVRTPIVVVAREPLGLTHRPALRLDVCKPTSSEQRMLWQGLLGVQAEKLNGDLDALVAQFNMNAQEIDNVANAMSVRDVDQDKPPLWETCRIQARGRLEHLAQRVVSETSWDDLVLPETQLRTLQEMARQLRWRAKVYERWGFARRSSRGLGMSALFSGSSGTGKTLAAEVLANELQLDLYRIDLSSVVSKYIGETEKNLRRVFDAAESSGAVLLFDEADALFGRRSEVSDSHDRYANIEVSYLLQRVETYRGLAILTTNMKQALDDAFLRRIRFTVNFSFPDSAQRAEIWRRVFPAQTPIDRLDFARLAQLNVTGGNIRNIALSAAFLAAHEDFPVGMHHLLRAAQAEYMKIERPLTDAETKGWA